MTIFDDCIFFTPLPMLGEGLGVRASSFGIFPLNLLPPNPQFWGKPDEKIMQTISN
jgi:hypothetical protein